MSSLLLSAKYKIYIIDEVHMLTREAFNALLKTLEEPPAHVIFIFATTENHKVPATILSAASAMIFAGFLLHLRARKDDGLQPGPRRFTGRAAAARGVRVGARSQLGGQGGPPRRVRKTEHPPRAD